MHVRMLFVEVTGNEELCITDVHPLHVFKCDVRHDTVRQTWLILFGKTQCNVSDWF